MLTFQFVSIYANVAVTLRTLRNDSELNVLNLNERVDIPKHGVQRRMISVDNFFVFLDYY